jgi:hypothetical protein
MSDLSHKHILAFAIFFIALFAVLFVGVVAVHSRNMQRHATASNATHTQVTPTN